MLWVATVPPIILPFAMGIFVHGWKGCVTWAGLCLQLMGLTVALHGLEGTRKIFERPSAVHSTIAWMKKFPRWRIRVNLEGRSSSMNSARGGAKVQALGRVNLDQSTSIEDRVAFLERQMIDVQDYLHKEFSSQKYEYRTSIDNERIHVNQKLDQIWRTIFNAIPDGYHLALVSICWICFGTIFSTIPEEIGGGLKLVFCGSL